MDDPDATIVIGILLCRRVRFGFSTSCLFRGAKDKNLVLFFTFFDGLLLTEPRSEDLRCSADSAHERKDAGSLDIVVDRAGYWRC